MTADTPMTLADSIDAIEDSYAFMLAYAGQGRASGDEGAEIRDSLNRAEAALAVVVRLDRNGGADQQAFIDMVRQDAGRARTALRFVLAQKSIGSQLVDNLNASIHLRTLLTDLFLLDEALKIGVG